MMDQSVDGKVQYQIQCFVCKQEMEFGIYKEHLTSVHNIKETSFFIENALHRMENPTVGPHDVVEVEVDDSNEDFRKQVMNKVDESLTKIFAPIVQMCEEEGKLLGNQVVEEEDKNVMDEVLDNIFKELKSALAGQTLVEKCTKFNGNEPGNAGSAVITENSKEAKAADATKQIIEHPKHFAKKAPRLLNKTTNSSDPLDRECPKASCTFRTSKQGMRNLEAANHLVSVHKVTVVDIKEHPSKFAFKKVQAV